MNKPFHSKLTPFFAEIRDMRLKRHSWKEIANHIKRTHGISTAASSCYEFFKRHKRRPTPLGFPEETGTVSKVEKSSSVLSRLQELKNQSPQVKKTFSVGSDISPE